MALRFVSRSASATFRRFSSRAAAVPDSDRILIGNDVEGDEFSVNWSLVADGIVNSGSAFRNGRLPLLTTRLDKKVVGNKVESSKPQYVGKYAVTEAGDSIDQASFARAQAAVQTHLSQGCDLFVEDAGLGALSSLRVGVRVVSDSPALSLIVRNLLIPIPPRPVDHRARFNGWNLDERWDLKNGMTWNGKSYDFYENDNKMQRGQRPILATVGGNGQDVSVQYVETNNVIVGANVVAGSEAPVRAIIDALGQAACVLINTEQAAGLAVPSTTVVNGEATTVVVGADDSITEAAAAAAAAATKGLYGAYHNVLTTQGVSALWNGVIANTTGANPVAATSEVPLVVVNNHVAVATSPNNMANKAAKFVFFKAGAAKSTLTAEEAVKRLVDLSGPEKAALAAELVKGATLIEAGSASDCF